MTPAARLIDWMGGLTIQQGEHAGRKFGAVMAPFQRRFVRALMGHTEAALTIGRGNGKTTLAGALAAACVRGPLAAPRGEVLLVCPTFAQAERSFGHMYAFLRRGIEREGRQHWRLVHTTNTALIEDRRTGMKMIALSSAPQSLHGYAPLLVIADEPAQWRETRSAEMIAALRTALGKHPDTRLVAIGTRPARPDHWFSQMLDHGGPGVYAQTHAAAAGEDPFSMRAIRRANPMLDVIRSLKKELIRARDLARKFGAEHLAQWNAYRLNLGATGVASKEPIVTVDDWLGCVSPGGAPAVGPVRVGFDLGGSSSMTALVAYWPETGRIEARGAFPATPQLRDRALRDGAGRLYEQMLDRQEITIYPGRVTPVAAFLRSQARRLQGHEVTGAVADRYRQAEAQTALAAAGITWPMEWRAVGAGQQGSADVRAFQAAVFAGRIASPPSLLMESAIAESEVRHDRNGNAWLEKARQRGRIDALQAALLAVGAGLRSQDEQYETRTPAAVEDYLLTELYR